MTNEIDGFDLIARQAYGESGVPHEQWRALRQLEGLHHWSPEGFDPFYSVVRHDEICEISKQPDRFLNHFRTHLTRRRARAAMPESCESGAQARDVTLSLRNAQPWI